MDPQITSNDLKKIEAGIREKYVNVAKTPEGQFAYPTGKKALEILHYPKALIDQLPESVAASYCGVGNPFSLGDITPGEHILDIGCGAGVETLLSGMMTGPAGHATGVDIVPEMLERAEANLQVTGLKNVSFQQAAGENLPFPENSFDVVISNGAINLIPHKEKTLKEILRVLKPGGRLMMADQVTAGTLQKDLKIRIASWFQ